MKKNSGSLARRYGSALYTSLLALSKNDKAAFDQNVEIVRTLSKLFDKKIIAFFANPILSNKEKSEVLKAGFGNQHIPREVFNFLQLVLEKNRFAVLPAMLKHFLVQADEFMGITRATLTSARKLPAESIADFSTALSAKYKKKVILDTQINEDLHSGFIVKVGNTKIDSSLRSYLLNLKEFVF